MPEWQAYKNDFLCTLLGLKFSFNSLQDLIKQTPEDHADYEVLTNVLNTTKDFLAKITGDDRDSGVSNMLGSTNIAEVAKQSETSIFIVR